MKNIALLIFFLLLFLSTNAQDKIISINYDTIQCTILSINNTSILYEQKNKDETVTGKFILLSQVAEYKCSHQLGNELKMQQTPTQGYIKTHFCFSLNIGKSIMPWYFDNYPSLFSKPEYYKKLKIGFHINANAYYMLKDYIGLGIDYSFFKTSTNGSFPRTYSSSVFLIETEKYNQYINYLGISVLFRQYLDARRKIILSEPLSVGLLYFRSENQSTYPNLNQFNYNVSSNNMLVTGNSLSGKFGLTAEYKLCEAFSVGLGGDFIWCPLKNVNFELRGSDNDGFPNEKQQFPYNMELSRIDYSLVLRYQF